MYKKIKNVSKDIVYTISANILYNGFLQFFIYPLISLTVNDVLFGKIIYIEGLVLIFAPAIGNAAGAIRLLEKQDEINSRKKYLIAVGVLFGVYVVPFVLMSYNNIYTHLEIFQITLLLFLSILRYFNESEYKIMLDFKGYFIYYIVLSCGYAIGLFLFIVTKKWICIFFSGEFLAFVFMLFSKRSTNCKRCILPDVSIMKKTVALSFTYLIGTTICNIDKIILNFKGNETMVSQYYVASLIGKTFAMLVAPLNMIVLSYSTKNNIVYTKKKYILIHVIALGVGIAAWLCMGFFSPLFIRIMYTNYLSEVTDILWIVNASQIAYFMCSFSLNMLLTFGKIKWQVIMHTVTLISIIILSDIMIEQHGMSGMAIAALIVNTVELIILFLQGYNKCIK